METLGSRIEYRLSKIGINQSELSRRLGVTPQSVQQWIKGSTAPRGKRLDALEKALMCSKEWLLFGSGEPNIKPPEPAFNSMDINDIRRANLLEQQKLSGLNKSQFAAKCCRDASQFSQIYNGHRELGTTQARELEKILSLPYGYLDVPHTLESLSNDKVRQIEETAANYTTSSPFESIDSPRSAIILEKLVNSAAQGILTEDDLEFLDQMATRLAVKSGNEGNAAHNRLRNKLQNDDSNSEA
jgi:transcriptional regulator with XRE-family HTH domain